ncbi:MAG: sugar phosphate isomerase/epimerase [Planctomycetaceae bacterium]|nr:sugar phosphate isomerase/epimerase [Planctomycetaceae bacterium]
MFIAATTGSFANLSFEAACTQIADLEFDRIEITFSSPEADFSVDSIVADVDAAMLRCRNSTRLSICAFNITYDLPLDHFPALFKLAKLIKVSQVTIPSLELGTPFNDETDRLKQLVHQATQDGIRLSLKTENGRLTEDPLTAVELCKTVKGLGITLDPSHYTTGPHRNQDYDIVLPYTTHVHFRDSTPDQFQVPVGLGEIDYSRVMTGLKRFDYRRVFSVDLVPEGMAQDAIGLEMRKLRMLLETLL